MSLKITKGRVQMCGFFALNSDQGENWCQRVGLHHRFILVRVPIIFWPWSASGGSRNW